MSPMTEPHTDVEGYGVAASSGSTGGLGRETAGTMLAAAREASGLSLEQIAHETRVPMRHLLALENDRHDALPALPYAIGFVKAFARAVKLDPETLAARFRSETVMTPHVPTAMKDEPMDERRLPTARLVGGGIAVVVALVIGVGLYGAGVFDAAPEPDAVAEAPDAAAPAQAPATPADMPTAEAPLATSAAPAASPLPTAGEVVLTAREDVWVKIYDGRTRAVAKMGIMTPGERYVVPAGQDSLVLRTGKAGAVAITIAGRALPPLGSPVETIDRVPLGAAALAARFTPAGAPSPVQSPSMPSAAASPPAAQGE